MTTGGAASTSDAGSLATYIILYSMGFAAAGLIAYLVGGWVRAGGAGRLTRRVLRRPAATPWATGEWACGACHTVNRASLVACERCRAPRAAAQMTFARVPTEPDIIPASIPAGAGSTVSLEHNPAAHLEGLNGHWRLRVNSVIVGSAARRDGALALLRAVEGVSAVVFDPDGAGYAHYALPALIAAFESPKLPLAAPCPERGK